MKVALIASLLLLAGPAMAARPRPAPPNAARLMEKGEQQFNQGEFQAALRSLDSAAAASKQDALTAKIHLLRGQVLAAQQRTDDAESAFVKTLEYEPEASLDPQRVDPAVVKLLERVRNRLRGELRVRADAGAGKVLLDGKVVGNLPYSGQHAIGKHRVEVRGADGRNASRELVLAANRVVELDLALAAPEVVVVADPPQKAEVAPEPSPVDQLHRAGGRLVIDARIPIEPLMAEWYGIEIGLGAEIRRWRVMLDARYSPTDPGLWGLTARGQLRVPLTKQMGVYGHAELPLFFTPYAAAGVGTGAGFELKLNEWLTGYAEGSVRYFLQSQTPFQPFRIGITGGLLFALGK